MAASQLPVVTWLHLLSPVLAYAEAMLDAQAQSERRPQLPMWLVVVSGRPARPGDLLRRLRAVVQTHYCFE